MEFKWGIIWGVWVSLVMWGLQAKVFAGECTAQVKNVAYSANFEMPDANGTLQKMHIRVGQTAGAKEMVADIFTSNECLATCRIKHIAQSGAPQPVVTDFSCDGAFSAPATLFWSLNNPSLRFGTWLDGYKMVSIKKIQENPVLIASLISSDARNRALASSKATVRN